MARRAIVIQEQRQKHSNVLLLEAGNCLLGQPTADRSAGKVVVEAMNKLGYDAMNLGERDFDQGSQTVSERAAQASFPMLSTNLAKAGELEPVGEPYTIVTVSDRKIAIIGLSHIDNQLPQGMEPEVVENGYVERARDVIEQLKGETNAIIVLSTLGLDNEQELAKQVKGITAIIGGGSGAKTPEPIIAGENNTPIVRTYGNGEELGVLSLTIDANGQAKNVQGQLILLAEDEYAEDPEMLNMIATYVSQEQN